MRILLPILTVTLASTAVVLYTGFNGLYGQDAHEYYRYANALLQWLNHSTPPGDYFWPVGYPLLGAVAAYVTHIPLLAVLQFVSIAGLAVVVAVIAAWPQQTAQSGKHQALYALVAVGFVPLLWCHGLFCMSDMAATVFIALAAYAYTQLHHTLRIGWLFVFAIAAAASVTTRYAGAVILLPIGISVAYITITRIHGAWLLPAVLLAGVVFIPHFVIRRGNPLGFVQHQWVISWQAGNLFKQVFTTPDGTMAYKLPNLLYVFSFLFHPYLGVAALVALPFVRIKQLAGSAVNRTLLLAIGLYLLFLSGIPFQNKRFLFPVVPLAAVLLYPAFYRLLNWVGKPLLVLGAISIVQMGLFAKAFQPFYERHLLEKQLTALVAKYPDKTLYTFDVDMALQSYGTNKQVHNLWASRYPTFTCPALVLFNPARFAEQWQGMNPMLNWQHLQQNYHLQLLSSHANGWQLYRITPCN